MFFNHNTFENSSPSGIPVIEILGDPPRFVPLRNTHLSGEVVGPLVSLKATQVFGFTREECASTLEALYRFPLPGDAAVQEVRVEFGEVQIAAELKERRHAEHEYQQARLRGRQAVLTTRESPDVFTLHLAGLRPDEEIRIEIRFVLLARWDENNWAMHLPLTTVPRFVREDELPGRHAQGQPLYSLRDPGHRVSVDMFFRDAVSVTSSTHPVSVQEQGDAVRVSLQDVVPVRDLVLTWRSKQQTTAPALNVALHREADYDYFLATICPPASSSPEDRLSLEVVLLVQCHEVKL